MSNEPVWRGSYRGDLQQLHRGLRFCVACSSVSTKPFVIVN